MVSYVLPSPCSVLSPILFYVNINICIISLLRQLHVRCPSLWVVIFSCFTCGIFLVFLQLYSIILDVHHHSDPIKKLFVSTFFFSQQKQFHNKWFYTDAILFICKIFVRYSWKCDCQIWVYMYFYFFFEFLTQLSLGSSIHDPYSLYLVDNLLSEERNRKHFF